MYTGQNDHVPNIQVMYDINIDINCIYFKQTITQFKFPYRATPGATIKTLFVCPLLTLDSRVRQVGK